MMVANLVPTGNPGSTLFRSPSGRADADSGVARRTMIRDDLRTSILSVQWTYSPDFVGRMNFKV